MGVNRNGHGVLREMVSADTRISGHSGTGLSCIGMRDLDSMTARPPPAKRALPATLRTKLGFQRRNSKAAKLPPLMENESNTPKHSNREHKKPKMSRNSKKASRREPPAARPVARQPQKAREVKRPKSRQSPYPTHANAPDTKLPKASLATQESLTAAQQRRQSKGGRSGIKPPTDMKPPRGAHAVKAPQAVKTPRRSSLPVRSAEAMQERAEAIAKQLEDELAALGSDDDL